MLSKMCRKCGLYHPTNVCAARNARCFHCNKLGHYARQCFQKGNFSTALILARKKQRDTERMTSFITMKNFQNMPFFGLETKEITSFFPKHQNLHVQYKSVISYLMEECEDETSLRDTVCEHLENKVSELEQKSKNDQELLQRNIEMVASIEAVSSKQEIENQKLHAQVYELQQKVLKEQKRVQITEDAKNNAEYLIGKTEEKLQNYKDQIAELEAKLLETEKLNQEQFTKLKDELTTANKTVENHKARLQEITYHRDAVFKHLLNVNDYFLNLKLCYDQTQREFMSVLKSVYQEKATPVRPARNFSCRRCGSCVHHKISDCVAQGNKCFRCEKMNHFTKSCSNWLKPIIMETSLIELLPRIEREMKRNETERQTTK